MSTRIETLGGHTVDPLNMSADDLRINDIATALSNQCRFAGLTERFYSTAEHSVYVARLVAMRLSATFGFNDWRAVCKHPVHRRVVLQGLLHDAPEYVLNDSLSPVKRSPRWEGYRSAESDLWLVVAKKFDVPVDMHLYVDEADKRIASTERNVLKPGEPPSDVWAAFMKKWPPYSGEWDIIDRYEVAPRQARRRFLDFYETVREA